MTASRATTARLVQILAATLAALVGAYLLGWAWRWPHSDIRDAGARVIGVTALLTGAVALIGTLRSDGPVVRALVVLVSTTNRVRGTMV